MKSQTHVHYKNGDFSLLLAGAVEIPDNKIKKIEVITPEDPHWIECCDGRINISWVFTPGQMENKITVGPLEKITVISISNLHTNNLVTFTQDDNNMLSIQITPRD